MEELVYLLKVPANQDVQGAVTQRLMLKQAPQYIRIATIAPISNYGYPAGTEGALLGILDGGVVVGVEGKEDVPRAFIPWQNVAYLADGADLYEKTRKS